MEGGPNQPNDYLDPQMTILQCLQHINDLPLTEKDKALISVLLDGDKVGTLEIALNNKHVKKLDIVPQNPAHIANQISEAFDGLYDVLEELRKDNQKEGEEYKLTFTDARLQ